MSRLYRFKVHYVIICLSINRSCTHLRHTIRRLSSRNNISALPQPEHHHRTSGSGFTCRFSCLIQMFLEETRKSNSVFEKVYNFQL